MRNILYYKGYTQYHNIGDQLINRSLLDYFRKFSKVIVSTGGMPLFYTDALALEAEERSSAYAGNFHMQLVLRALTAVFQKDTRIYFLASPPGDQSTYSFLAGCKYFLSGGLYLLLYLLGVRIIKIGFSIGPLGRMAKAGERFRALFIRHYYVRDSISLRFVQTMGIKQAKLFPDLCWSYQPTTYPQNMDIPSAESPKIMLSFRDGVHSEHSTETYQDSLVSLLSQFVHAHQEQYRFQVSFQVASDATFSEFLYTHIKSFAPVSFMTEQIDLADAFQYQSASLVLTNRLHVALLAAKFGCLPVIVTDIGRHVKIKGIFQDAGLHPLLLDTQQAPTDNLTRLAGILTNRQVYLAKIQQAEKTYAQLSTNIMNHIFSS